VLKFVRLHRFAYLPVGTFGRLEVMGTVMPTCFTVERPWMDNKRNVSCIPEGSYPLVRDYYHRGDYPAYEVREVPGRSRILIHVANEPMEVAGCIAPGLSFGFNRVIASRPAYRRFMDAMEGVSETLVDIRFNERAGLWPVT
jgi:hypothetical protein